MKKKTLLFCASALSVLSIAWAAETMWIHQTDRMTLGMPLEMADSIKVSDDGATISFVALNGVGTYSVANTLIEKVTFGDSETIVTINYDGDDAEIVNPFAFKGVTITKTGADVVVTSTSLSEITYQLTGTTATGSFKIYSDKKFQLDMNSVSITNDDGAAINIQTGKKCTVNLIGTSNLVDAVSYTSVSGEDQKGCFFSEGQIIFTGSGTLNVTGNYKHGICSDDYIDIQSGTINILKAANDGIRVNDYFLMTNGVLTTAATGDGIDGDAGYIQIDGGTMNVIVSTADTKGIKCDSIIIVNGGNIDLTVPAAQGKGFKTKQTMTVNGGIITANMTGDVAIVANDPSYCSAIKADIDFVQTNGTINITHSGAGGRGISADNNVNLQGGTLTITVTGGNGTYTNTSGVTDNYAPTCVSADGNVNVTGGNITLNVKANSAKGFKSDLNTNISGGTITGTLTGSSVVVNYDPSHCTLIKCDGNYTMNGGTINATHSGVGGKGISVDGIATFNSGNVTITTSGSAASYTASSGTDTYSPICISVDGNLYLLGGTFNVKSTGAGGKCIKSDQQIIMGTIDGESPEISVTPSIGSGSMTQVWNYSQNGGNSSSWVTTGSQGVEDIALANGKLYAVCRGSSATDHTIKIINAYTGAQTGTLNTTSCTAGTYNLSSVETLGSTILACNLAANTSTNLVIYKWDSDSSTPTILLNSTPPCTRAGDAMSVSGDMTSGRIWFAYGSQVYYYTISNGAITSTTPTTINLTKNGSAYEIASGVPYSNITVESDGSFWVSSSLANYVATHFSSNGAYIEELTSGLVNNQGTDIKFFTYNGVKYAAASTYLNRSNTAITEGAVSVINMSTSSVEGTYPSAGLGSTRNTCFRSSVCAEAGTDYYYVWVNVPFQGVACYKYSEPTSDDDSGNSGEEDSGSTTTGEIAPLVVTAETTGAQFGSSSSSGQPGRPGAPGSSTSTSGSTSPKVIKAMAAMTIYSGSFTIKSSNEGGEGLESKTTMTINGGNFYFNTYDDCLNAATALNINGGNLRCVATGNDAVDSNGAMTITGGLVLASGSRDPEEGIDVDSASKLSITGGTVINQKGNMLNLTTTQCKVPTIKYSSSISAGTLITITDSSGKHILSFKAPQAMSQGCYITLPEFVSGSSYKLYTGGSVSGGTVFNEVTKGGTFSGGTLKKTFTISSNLVSL